MRREIREPSRVKSESKARSWPCHETGLPGAPRPDGGAQSLGNVTALEAGQQARAGSPLETLIFAMGCDFLPRYDWRMQRLRAKTEEQERLALDQRAANERAARAGEPLPFPNMWDRLDPTKVARDASPDELQASYVAFGKLCRPRPRRRHHL